MPFCFEIQQDCNPWIVFKYSKTVFYLSECMYLPMYFNEPQLSYCQILSTVRKDKNVLPKQVSIFKENRHAVGLPLCPYFSCSLTNGYVLISKIIHIYFLRRCPLFTGLKMQNRCTIPTFSTICIEFSALDVLAIHIYFLRVFPSVFHSLKGTRGGPAWCLDTFAFFFYYQRIY